MVGYLVGIIFRQGGLCETKDGLWLVYNGLPADHSF
jgi:hypothetical protein